MGSLDRPGRFTVEIKSKEVVKPASPLPEYWLPMFNMDLLIPAVTPSLFFVYKNPFGHDFDSIVNNLKRSLGQVLVSFYAIAGEVVVNKLAEPELHCNNRGVDFTVAHADIELENLDYHNPTMILDGKLLPALDKGTICMQVTKLKCGGLTLSWMVDHRVIEAYSTDMFMDAWAQVTRTGSTSIFPNFRRSLLAPRRPGSYDKSVSDLYLVVPSMSQPATDNDHQPPPAAVQSQPASDHLTSRIYYMCGKDMDQLQAAASSHGAKRSKLEAFSGCLWKIIASTSTSERRICKMGIVVDGRSRLIDPDNKGVDLATYFGNVLSIPCGGIDGDELVEKPLTWVVDQVHEFLTKGTTKEHFLGLIDWVEEIRPRPAISKIYMSGSQDGPSFVVSYGRIFQAKKLDFGWGSPVFGTTHFPWGGECGYVMPMPTPADNGDWIIYMLLFKHELDVVEAQWRHILHPLSAGHLNLK